MNRFFVSTLLLLGLGCHSGHGAAANSNPVTPSTRPASVVKKGAASTKATSRKKPQLSGSSQQAASTSPQKESALYDPHGVVLRLREQLNQIGPNARRRVRITHWGDSHVAAGSLTGHLRLLFQEHFGNAGPGFVLVGHPWRSYRQDAVRYGADPRWHVERIWSRYTRRHRRPRDDLFGISGISTYIRRRGQFWVEPRRGALGAVDLYLLAQPKGGIIRVEADGRLVKRLSTRARKKNARRVRIDLPHNTHRVTLKTARGEVRLFGADFRSDAPGVLYDALGINGARAVSMLHWNEALMAQQLKQLGTDLVVLAYGSNAVDDPSLTAETYAKQLSAAINRLKTAAPKAQCLVIGAPDQARRHDNGTWELPDKLNWIITQQRHVAVQLGCAFWDQRKAMGGPGTIFRWRAADPPLARIDHVHFKHRGYQRIAELLFADLLGSLPLQ